MDDHVCTVTVQVWYCYTPNEHINIKCVLQIVNVDNFNHNKERTDLVVVNLSVGTQVNLSRSCCWN